MHGHRCKYPFVKSAKTSRKKTLVCSSDRDLESLDAPAVEPKHMEMRVMADRVDREFLPP